MDLNTHIEEVLKKVFERISDNSIEEYYIDLFLIPIDSVDNFRKKFIKRLLDI
jgi:hypothetical protein